MTQNIDVQQISINEIKETYNEPSKYETGENISFFGVKFAKIANRKTMTTSAFSNQTANFRLCYVEICTLLVRSYIFLIYRTEHGTGLRLGIYK